jgi:hypothetical protein
MEVLCPESDLIVTLSKSQNAFSAKYVFTAKYVVYPIP